MKMEAQVSGFTFFSTFDSGNLQKVEGIPYESHPLEGLPEVADEMPVEKGGPLLPTDYNFRIWTRPDCATTEFENGNRTWFYFGFRGGPTDLDPKDPDSYPTLRFTVMNLNKQSKLFSQGMAPIVMAVPLPHTIHSLSKDKMQLKHQYPQTWERIRDKPTYWTLNNEQKNFVVSFRVRCDPRATTYVAFTYPYSYRDLQIFLSKLDRKYANDSSFHEKLQTQLEDKFSKIYFHRELLIRSLLNFRVDLLTITDSNGMSDEREPVLEHLFPDYPHTVRPRQFKGKKVIFVSARVHPGETQSSFVMNGFIKFILRDNDPRAEALRRKYVFKLIPMLNPDGVVHGHYRTDSRGVNLNRVYGSPSLELHPQIYAARKLILYAHYRKEIQEEEVEEEVAAVPEETKTDEESVKPNLDENRSESTPTPELPIINFKASTPITPANTSHWLRSCTNEPSSSAKSATSTLTNWYEMTETSRFSEGDESIADFSVVGDQQQQHQGRARLPPVLEVDKPRTSFSGAFGERSSKKASPRRALFQEEETIKILSETSNGSSTLGEVPKEEDANLDFPLNKPVQPQESNGTANTVKTPVISPKNSGIFLYVDIHGHASKRGIFMYGNHFTDMENQVGCMLLPKLMAINCAHFDFPACVFTEKNMYMKDRHTGAGREGSGRVSAFKATGLLYSYTLECNFNTGRIVNGLPMASRDCGRASPPPKLDHPPKYDPDLYEESGKAMAIAILDLTESNPWTRLTCSAHKNLRGVRDWLKKYIKAKAEEEQEKAAKGSPAKTSGQNLSTNSPGRASLRSSARRVRTFSSSSTSSKKKAKSASERPSTVGPHTSPESYRPMSKIARKNSLQQSQTPRGRKQATSESTSLGNGSGHTSGSGGSTTIVRSLSTTSAKRRPSTAVAVMRGRSQSVVLGKSPTRSPGSPTNTASILLPSVSKSSSVSSRSRPTSPSTKRPPSRAEVLSARADKSNGAKTKKKKSRKMSGVRKASSTSLEPTSNEEPLPTTPVKRLRRRQRKNKTDPQGEKYVE